MRNSRKFDREKRKTAHIKYQLSLLLTQRLAYLFSQHCTSTMLPFFPHEESERNLSKADNFNAKNKQNRY